MSHRHKQNIGYCELCGVLDHHLQAGICAGCADKVLYYNTHTRQTSVAPATEPVEQYLRSTEHDRQTPAPAHNDSAMPHFLVQQAI